MTSRYVVEQVTRALTTANGDAGTAVRLLARACADDPLLLREITAPYLAGMLGHLVSRIAGAPAPPAPQNAMRTGPVPAARLTDRSFDAVIGQLSKRIGTGEGRSRAAHILTPERRPAASQRHQDAIRAMAVAFARKRLEG